jgi:hypothetical protein
MAAPIARSAKDNMTGDFRKHRFEGSLASYGIPLAEPDIDKAQRSIDGVQHASKPSATKSKLGFGSPNISAYF